MDFDETRLYYSHQQLHEQNENNNDEAEASSPALADDEEGAIDLFAVRRHFREFLRNYRLGPQQFLYRSKLLKMHRRLTDSRTDTFTAGADAARNANKAKLVIDLAHVGEYDPAMLGYLLHQPATILPTLEGAASDALKSLLYDMKTSQDANTDANTDADADADDLGGAVEHEKDDNPLYAIQILLQGQLQATPLRSIRSEHMNRLLRCPGIVISTSPVKHRAYQLTVRCSNCLDTQRLYPGGSNNSNGGGPYSSILLPSRCQSHSEDCPSFPYTVVPDESHFCDQQSLKLQEAPEQVPTGEMPRSVLMVVEKSLVDTAPPGTRLSVLCIPTLFGGNGGGGGGANNTRGRDGGTKSLYLRVVGMSKDQSVHGPSTQFTPAEEAAFAALSQHPAVYDILSRSLAPKISGNYTVDIKKALMCQLMAGSAKRLPDGLKLRGDINVLLMGDPSMAKSQFLKFVSQVAPIGIYTSGKGSSAAGLTASVVKDSRGEFYLEGGAMVLADGGIVCIDEFDKMRPNDRVAIHEAMEQQTISVAKAGITTVLNSRAAVLAAANPLLGRYDDLRSLGENMDLMSTILSRFDLIFLVRDIREEERDRLICQHVMGVHLNSNLSNEDSMNGYSRDIDPSDSNNSNVVAAAAAASNSPDAIAEHVMQVATTTTSAQHAELTLSVPALKKYIQYCKQKCSPRLTEDAGQVLTSSYVKIREQVRLRNQNTTGATGTTATASDQAAIPITVRQLEALIRLSESLAKMRLDDKVQPQDITEALRLFSVSTMAANATDGNNNGGNHHHNQYNNMAMSAMQTSPEELDRTEGFLRSRLILGNLVNKQRLVEEAAGQGFHAMAVARTLSIMASRGEVLERNQGRLIKRIK